MARESVIRVSVIGDVDKLRQAFKDGENSVSSFSDTMANAGANLTKKVTLPIVAVGVASFKAAADLADAQGATKQIFGDTANSVIEWAKAFPDYYGIATGEALQHANIMGALLQNLGQMSEDAAAEQSQLLVELAGDLSAMFGGTTESAVTALTGALKGNTTMLDNYGIAANAASVEAEALAMGIWDGKGAMSQAQKQAATLNLIMKQTADSQGQAAREADGASGQLKQFSTGMKEMGETIGTILLPVGTKLLEWAGKLAEWFQNLSPGAQNLVVTLAGVAAAVGPVLLVGAKLVKAFQTVGIAFKALSALMATNPWILLIAAVVALVVLIVKNWDKIKEVITNAWDKIKEVTSTIWEGIQTAISTVLDVIKNLFLNFTGVGLIIQHWETIKEVTSTIWEGIQTAISTVLDVIKNLFLNFTGAGLLIKHWDKIRDATTALGDAIRGVWNGVMDFLKGLPAKVGSALKTLWTAPMAAVTTVGAWIESVWNGVVDFFRGMPAKIAAAVSGMWDGIKNAFKSAVNWIIDKWNNFSIPPLKVAGIQVTPRIDFPDIPRFHTGGVFRASTPGGEGLALLRDGERVLPTHQSGTPAATVVNVTINAGMGTDPYTVGSRLIDILQQYASVNGPIPIDVRTA